MKNKRVYFAGKFSLIKDNCLHLKDRLINDYRAALLGDPSLLVYPCEDLTVCDHFIYEGPFYCEEASEGVYTSNDCHAVLRAERRSVENADVYLAVFGESFSVGTVVELGWAIELDKEIVILYKIQQSSYSYASEYWFAIADAKERSDKVKIVSYSDESDLEGLITEVLGQYKEKGDIK